MHFITVEADLLGAFSHFRRMYWALFFTLCGLTGRFFTFGVDVLGTFLHLGCGGQGPFLMLSVVARDTWFNLRCI